MEAGEIPARARRREVHKKLQAYPKPQFGEMPLGESLRRRIAARRVEILSAQKPSFLYCERRFYEGN